MDETALSMSRDVNFLAVICQTNVPNDLLLWVFCFDEKTRVNEVESFFSEQTILLRGEGSSIKSVSSEAMIQVIIDGLDVPSERHGLKLRYLKGQVFQDSSLIVHNVVNHIPQLVFKLDQSGEILSTVTLAPTKETSKQVTATDDLASIVMEASPVVKQGVPTDNELEDLNRNIGIKWKQLGRRLSFSDEELLEIDMNNMLLYQKAYQMLKEWKNRNGFHATYQTLYAALSHQFVSCKDLAEKYCTFKKGVPTDDELEVISRKIANEWERLACRLSFSYKELQEIDLDKRHLSEKAYQMLKEWKNRNGFNATYKTLYAALSHKFVSRKDLAEKYFKQGVPTDDELEDLGQNIGDKWEQLGRRLSFSDEGLQVIDLDKRLLYQKALQLLKEWKKRNGSDATYQTLYAALSHRLVSRKDLAEKYFKQGVPTDYELEDLSQNIGNEWEQLGRRLSFSSKELQEIDLDIKHLSKKAYQMLKQWKNRNGSNATYQTLYAALNHGFVSVEQEEESGSATKIHRLNPVKEPGTLTLSSTSKTKKVKEKKVSHGDLQAIGRAIGFKWTRLARRLNIKEHDIEEIDEKYHLLSQKGYQALRLWSAINGREANYKTLHDKLVHPLVQRQDLAEKYCK